MAAKNKGGLGKGLDALFMDNSIEEEAKSAVKLKINDIEPNRAQPRKSFDEEALEELANSISTHGVIQPLLVRPLADGGYQLIAGERRWRASRMAGLTEVPVVIREMSDSEAMELALVENLQREDLNPIEEAQGLALLMETYGLTQEQAAKRVGKSRPAVANSMRLLSLPQEVLAMVERGELSAGHARTILALENAGQITALANEIIKKNLSVRETERAVKALLKGDTKKEKRAKKRDTYYDEVELAVSQSLGRKAKVSLSGGNKGTLEIEFFGKEDLSKLLKLFENE
ncbi:MAG: ParB/RepB/Spo0J family partition protein [Clostridiaceae bacterium]|nr:ParB/RepB/Spo0J family partition protein [Clostridiaceae bacterium]MDY5991647.1 ParB/RepB/Spo0J family partition protein [Oscillospiraceae bacterium]